MIKKVIISLMLFVCFASLAYADNIEEMLKNGVKKYKENDYLGSIQIMEEVIKKNPGSLLAHYYLAIANVKIGEIEKADLEYDIVISLAPESPLAEYATIGKNIIKNGSKEKEFQEETKKTVKSNKTDKKIDKVYSKKVKEDIEKRNIQFLIDKVNNNKKVDPSEFLKFKDFSPNKSSINKPSDEEIAKACQILMKAGVNPPINHDANLQMAQMNMLTSAIGGMNGANGQNNYMNMLPMMMMQAQNRQNNYDPEFMQSMISNMMMPNMMNLYEDKKY